MGLSSSIFLGFRGIFIGSICLLHIIAFGVFYIVDALIMIGRDRAAFQVVFHGLFHQSIPGVRPVYIGPIAVPGVDDSSHGHIAAPGIQGQGAPVEADGDFPVKGDLPAAGLDQPIILCPIRCAAAVHMAKIGTDRMARRICLARTGPFSIPFGIGRITGIFHRPAGSGGEISPIGIDVPIDDHGTDLVPVAVRIQDNIQFVGRGGDIAIDGDVPHGIQGKGGIFSCCLFDIIFDDDIGGSVSGCCLDGHIGARIQHFFHHIGRDPGHGAVHGRGIGGGGIGVVVADGGTATSEIRICSSFLFRVVIVAGGGGITVGNDHIQGVQQPFPGLALGPFGIDGQPISQAQHVPGSFDLSPVSIAFGQQVGIIVDQGLLADDFDAAGALAFCCTGGVQGAAHFHLAALAPVQEDLAFFVFPQGPGFDGAGVVHYGAQHIVGAFGGHHHIAPVGLDPAAVESFGLGQFSVHSVIQFPVAVRRQGQLFGGGQGYLAPCIADGAGVFHLGGMESHQAPLGGNGALIQDGAAVPVPDGQVQVGSAVCKALHIGIVQLGSGSHQAPYFNAGRLAEHHPVGVHQKQVPVGGQSPVDDGLLASSDPFQGHRIPAGLGEFHRFIPGNVELGPVHRHFPTLLGDGHVLPVLGNGALAGLDLAASGHSIGRSPQGQGQQHPRRQFPFPFLRIFQMFIHSSVPPVNLHLLEGHAADQPEVAVFMAGVADRFFSPQSPGIVCPDKPVLIPGPDQPDAHILEIPVVLFSRRGQAAVMVHPHAPMFQVEGQVQLLVLFLERQQPAEFRSCEIPGIPRAFTGGICPESVRPAQVEMF